ncbi:MAG: hypothetical protein INR65_14940, partial [Gluconacetobacter diazotrophicus]|nr:hypothetical protein [Gluconacetobacter diazotrophicus]
MPLRAADRDAPPSTRPGPDAPPERIPPGDAARPVARRLRPWNRILVNVALDGALAALAAPIA